MFAPLTHDEQGHILNTNADTISQEIATAMSSLYDVHLVYGFEKAGRWFHFDRMHDRNGRVADRLCRSPVLNGPMCSCRADLAGPGCGDIAIAFEDRRT